MHEVVKGFVFDYSVHGNQCTAGTVTDEERNGQKEAKAETSTSEPQIMVAATGTSILTNHSNGETPVSTSSCSSSDITLAAPRMD